MNLYEFMLGTLVMASSVVGLFFLRFWRRTRDRLFLIFSAAFWLMALNWALLATIGRDEVKTELYLIRLLAFVLILIAIVDKNRSSR